MSVTGLNPYDEDETLPGLIPPERLAEFDRLMAEGGIEAVMEKLRDKTERLK
jgi:hypothetical protein